MSFPPSPVSQGTSADSPVGQPTQLATSGTSPAPISGESVITPTPTANNAAAGGAVRRKPARRANTAERRATHNAVERQRRETLNGRFLDLAALLPNLVNVRRPSKSAIVNSSIALVHTQRRLRAIAAREVRALAREADLLRREVNEWRMAHPTQPVPAAIQSSEGRPIEPIPEPARSSDLITLMEVEEIDESEMNMTEQERIAYEMRGGDSGPLGATFEDGEDDLGYGDDDFAAARAPMMNGNGLSRQRAQSLSMAPRQGQFNQVQNPQQTMNGMPFAMQAAAAASLMPSHSSNPHALHQMMVQQQQQQQAGAQYPSFEAFQHAPHQNHYGQQMLGMPASYPTNSGFFPPSFDAIQAAAQNPQSAHQQGSDEAAKLAAWNAHLFSALTAQQREHANSGHYTPPSSSHGSTTGGPFGGSYARSEHSENSHDDMGPSTPSSRSSVPPSLSLSLSGLSSSGAGSQSSSPSIAAHPASFGLDVSGMPSSLPSALASPLHNLTISGDYMNAGTPGAGTPPLSAGAFFGSAPAAGGNWGAMQGKSPAGTPVGEQVKGIPVGGGNGGMGYHQFPMMNIFI